MHTHYNVELFKTHGHLYGIKTEEGKYYTLLRTSLAEALFVDERLHEKNLIINGRVFPNTQLLEVTRFSSIKDGVVHALYYYCDTCYIRAVAPGNCDCCQAPVVLIEKTAECRFHNTLAVGNQDSKFIVKPIITYTLYKTQRRL